VKAIQAATAPLRRATKRSLWTVGIVIAVCVACTGAGTVALFGLLDGEEDQPTTLALGCGTAAAVNVDNKLPEVPGLTSDQVRNAAIIVQVGQQLKVPPRGWVVGVATALQESWLTNHPNLGSRNDHDSIGLFQQRPSQGWGTVAQLSDPAYQARKFFQKLVKVRNWQALPLTLAAQRVQISAYPQAYAKHEPRATTIVDLLTGGGGRAAGNLVNVRCVTAGEVTASGWTVPIKGPITSGFRTAGRPGHNGVDIGMPKGTPIRASTSGVVLTSRCSATLASGAFWGCDRDGGLFVTGCGWYVELQHAGNIITRYCHMRTRPRVSVGQVVSAGEVIGEVGSSGNSTGPHLHFEVHTNGDRTGRGAVNPLTFMNQAGAPLGGSSA
jgi:murein DD-endopeptidase MepM/ murein hydrolase activator NlpD